MWIPCCSEHSVNIGPEFARAVDVVGADPEPFLYPAPHLLRPGLRTQDPDPEISVVPDRDAHLLRHLRDVEEVGGGAGDGGYVEILHQFHLALGVPHACREDCRPETLGAVVCTEPPGKSP